MNGDATNDTLRPVAEPEACPALGTDRLDVEVTVPRATQDRVSSACGTRRLRAGTRPSLSPTIGSGAAPFDGQGCCEGSVEATGHETERTQPEEHTRQLDVLTEREPIGNDLCQSIVHQIFAAGLALQGARTLVDHPVAATRINQAVELLDDTIRQIRTVVFDLHQDQLMQVRTPTAAGTIEVTFELPAAVTAEHIALCGEFNNWSETASPMCQADNGRWHTTVPLQPGRRYRYRYLADGERWINDWAADDYITNPFGGADSVICL